MTERRTVLPIRSQNWENTASFILGMLVKSRGFFNAIRSKAIRQPEYISRGPYVVFARKEDGKP